MDLRDFVGGVLISIAEGVGDAQAKASDLGLSINPIARVFHDPDKDNETRARGGVPIGIKVHFDVAVTASDSGTTGGKAGLKVWVVEAGGEHNSSFANSQVSRVSFDVPVILPPGLNHGMSPR